jgi:SCP-2 sterol transfer family
MPRPHRLIELGVTVPKYPFLSDEWFIEVRRIVEELAVEVPPHARVRMNVVVTHTPFGDDRQLHVGTSEAGDDWGSGLLDDADLTLTTDYVTARDIFVSANPQSGMQAFMDGKVKLQGDLTKLMAAQMAGTGPGAPGLATALSEITE